MMRTLFKPTIGLIFGAVSVAVALGQGERPNLSGLPEIVQKAIRASGNLKYSGERVVELREGPERIRNIETVWRDGGNVRIEFGDSSSSKGQIIVERNGKRYHYFPDRNEIHVAPINREDVVMRLLGSMRMISDGRGKVDVSEGEAVAGLRTTKVTFVEKSNGRMMQAMWIEPRTGLILKRELFDRGGARQGYFEFSRVNLNPRLRNDDFKLRIPGAKFLSQIDLAMQLMRRAGFAQVFLDERDGLVLQGSRLFGDNKILALHYRTPKGLLSFMQIKEADSNRFKEGGPRRGKETIYSWQREGKSFVLVGPFTTAELQSFSQRAQDR